MATDDDDGAPLPPQVAKLREKLQESRQARELEQHKHTVLVTELKAKLHEERARELAAAREALQRQHEQELARCLKMRDGETQRLQALVTALRDGAADKLKSALLGEAREEARRAFDGERARLQQEIGELKAARRQGDEALGNALRADKAKAADLRAAFQAHQDEVNRIKRDCERDIRRLVSGQQGAWRPSGGFWGRKVTVVSLGVGCPYIGACWAHPSIHPPSHAEQGGGTRFSNRSVLIGVPVDSPSHALSPLLSILLFV